MEGMWERDPMVRQEDGEVRSHLFFSSSPFLRSTLLLAEGCRLGLQGLVTLW